MVDTTTSTESPNATSTPKPALADDTAHIAASLLVMSESIEQRSMRRALRRAADAVNAGEDIESVAARCPRRTAALLRCGAESNCLPDLLRVERKNESDRRRRDRLVGNLLGYNVVLTVLITAFLVVLTWFGWTLLRPLEREIADVLGHMGGTDTDYYKSLLLFTTSIATIASTAVTAFVAAYFFRLITQSDGPPLWTYCFPNGRAIRNGDATAEGFRFLAAYLERDVPLPVAFFAIQRFGYSSATKRIAKTAQMLAEAGADPIEAFPADSLLSRTTHSPHLHPGQLTTQHVQDSADLIAAVTDSETETGARAIRFYSSIALGGLLALSFAVIAAPSIVHIFFFRFSLF